MKTSDDEDREASAGRNGGPLPRVRGRVREGAARFRPRGFRNLELARRLRREMTEAERKLWQALRAHRFIGLSIRRQAMIETYVVDFLCEAKRLVIEVDGGQHLAPEGLVRDDVRSRALAKAGYRVVRYSNLDVLTNLDGVLQHLASVCRGEPPPKPSPASGGGLREEVK